MQDIEEDKKEDNQEDQVMNEANGNGDQASAMNDGSEIDEGMSSEDQKNFGGPGQPAFGTVTRSGGGAKSRLVPKAGKRPVNGPGPGGF